MLCLMHVLQHELCFAMSCKTYQPPYTGFASSTIVVSARHLGATKSRIRTLFGQFMHAQGTKLIQLTTTTHAGWQCAQPSMI